MHTTRIAICVEPFGNQWRFLQFSEFEGEPFKAGTLESLYDLPAYLPPPGWDGIPKFSIVVSRVEGELSTLFRQDQLAQIESFRSSYIEISPSVFVVDEEKAMEGIAEEFNIDRGQPPHDIYTEVIASCAMIWEEDVADLDLGIEFQTLILGLTTSAKRSKAKATYGKDKGTELVEVTVLFGEEHWKVPSRGIADHGVLSVETLSKLATKGDVEAIRALFARGAALLETGEVQDAAEALKDAAICFRIEAFRQRSRADEATAKINWQEKQLRLLSEWVRDHQDQAPTPGDFRVNGITEKDVHSILYKKIYPDPRHQELLDDLFRTLVDRGYQFSAPGNSYPRLLWHLVASTIGASRNTQQKSLYLSDPVIGILFERLLRIVLAEIAAVQAIDAEGED